MVKELKVKPIENGTVIDHIPAGMALKVIAILSSGRHMGKPMSIMMNVESSGRKRKDIVKMEQLELKKREVDKIALIAPDATINIIRDHEVVEKRKVKAPKRVVGIVKCNNPNCVSNQKEPIPPEFDVISTKPLCIRCSYCERDMEDITENLL